MENGGGKVAEEKQILADKLKGGVKDSDLKLVALVGAFAALLLIIFGVAIFWSGLIEFPAMSGDGSEKDPFRDAMIYRERRVYLALVFRTFLTGFSFVVGLALSTMGGLFILRQVKSLTTISGGIGPDGLPGFGESKQDHQKALADTQFAFKSYSPGVVFMVGGVIVMTVSQGLAIPITTIEVVPPESAVWRQNEVGGPFELVRQARQPAYNQAPPPAEYSGPEDACKNPENQTEFCQNFGSAKDE